MPLRFFEKNFCNFLRFQKKFVSLHAKRAKLGCASAIGASSIAFGLHEPCSEKKIGDQRMATYTITLNERSARGKALMEYLQALGILMHKVSPKAKSSYQRSQEDKQAGRVEKFSSSEEMFKSLGILNPTGF